jgi:methionyl aminopeptidase
MAILKSRREIELMRQAGCIVYRVLEHLRQIAKPGVTTAELDAVAEQMICQAGAEALFKGVRSAEASFPFPAAICASLNEEVVHGIPGSRELKEGDILSVDCGVRLKGYCGDAATTIAVGTVEPEVQRLLQVTQEALEVAIREVRPGRGWNEVARQMQRHVEDAGMSVVRKFVGHGIGREMHEDPKVPNFVEPGQRQDIPLEPGLVLAVEPMVNLGTAGVKYADSTGWTVVTTDGRPSAHFEHMLAVTSDGVDVLSDGHGTAAADR